MASRLTLTAMSLLTICVFSILSYVELRCDAFIASAPLRNAIKPGRAVGLAAAPKRGGPRSPGSGFAASRATRRKKSSSTTDASALTVEAGWVELLDLDKETLTAGGQAQAVGRSISGKPYLVRRSMRGDIITTGVACGRCEYPLVKSDLTINDGIEEIACSMCGGAYDARSGDARAESGKGNILFGALLRNKPQLSLPSYPTKELADGRVFVNIEAIGRN